MADGEAEFGGKCALGQGLGLGDRAPEGKAEYAVEKNGKTYYLSGAVPKFLFEHVPGLAGLAEKKAAA